MNGLTKELMTLRPARKLPRGRSLMTRGLRKLEVVTRIESIRGLPGSSEHVLDTLDFGKGGCEFSVWVV